MVCKFFRCYWYFFFIFYLNFFTAITSVRFWFRKVDVEVIIKNKSVLGRFLCLDILLFALLFLLVKIVHFLYVPIYLKILFISFQKEFICLMIASLSAGETRHCIAFHVYLFHQFCQQQKSGPFSYAYYRPFSGLLLMLQSRTFYRPSLSLYHGRKIGVGFLFFLWIQVAGN